MELTLSFKSSDISCTQTQLNYCLESKLPEDFDKDNAETQVLNNKTYYKYGKSQEIAVIEGTYSSSNNEIVITNTDNQQMRLQKTSDGNMEVTSIDPNFINVNVPVGTIFEVK